MAMVRVVWDAKGVAKRSSATGPDPATDVTLLTKAGGPLAKGKYLANWTFSGETGDTMTLTIQQQVGGAWKDLCATGPHKIPNNAGSINSTSRRPTGYVDLVFKI